MQGFTGLIVRAIKIIQVVLGLYFLVFWITNALRTSTKCDSGQGVCHVRLEIYYLKLPMNKEPMKEAKTKHIRVDLYAKR